MKKTLLITAAILTIGLGTAGILWLNRPEFDPDAPIETVAPVLSELDQINAVRAKVGKPPLVEDARLDAAAKAKVEDMITRRYFLHSLPGESAWQFLPADLQARVRGENQAKCQTSVTERVTQWVNSPEHYSVMIGEFTIWGTYTAVDPRDKCSTTINYFVR